MGQRKTSYGDLEVWHKAMDLAVVVYRLTEAYPRHELYGLVSQMRRCATSVPANIAEGRGRCSDADFCRFLYIASGSVAELETFLELSRRLAYGTPEAIDCASTATAEVGRMIYGLIGTVRGTLSG